MAERISTLRCHWLIERIRTFASRPSIIENEKKHSYADLFSAVEESNKFLFSQGVRPGEVIAILADYTFYSIAFMLALFRNKNIVVPITSKLSSEIQEMLDYANVDKVVRLDENEFSCSTVKNKAAKSHRLIQELEKKQSAGLILFSSGSTGKPKAMVHNLDNFVDVYNPKKRRELTIILFLMFDHIGGINTLFSALSMGASLVLCPDRNAENVCMLIETHSVQLLPTSPTFLNLLLLSEMHKKYDLSSLRIISYGTEPMPQSLLVRLREAFPKVRFVQTFGTSETGISQTLSKSSQSTLLRIDDPNTSYKIVNGELWLQSKTQIIGYLNHDMDSFTEDGWFKTGDLAEETDDGFLRLIGRTNEIINVGGEKVLPGEVEEILLAIPEINDCVVYGEQNAITGQTVVADVVLNRNSDYKTIKKTIRRYCRNKIDAYKIPTKVNSVNQIDFTARFKKIRRYS